MNGLVKGFPVRILSNDFKCALPDDSAAVRADIQIIPFALHWLNFISIAVARIETTAAWGVSTDANPRVRVILFAGYKLILDCVWN